MQYRHLLSILSLGFLAATASATSINLYDENYSLFNGDTKLDTGLFDVRWGSYDNGVFTPFLSFDYNENNTGYIDIESPELLVTLTQGDNNVVAAGLQLAISISLREFGTTYESSPLEIILTDPQWIAPTFVLVGSNLTVYFSESTVALKGSYSYNGGNEVLNFVGSAIPEPSAFAAIAGLGILGFAATRRKRSA